MWNILLNYKHVCKQAAEKVMLEWNKSLILHFYYRSFKIKTYFLYTAIQ